MAFKTPEQRPQRGAGVRRTVIGVVLVLAAALATRLESILHPAERNWDEATFLVVADRMTHFELPYTTTFENKSPLSVVPQALSLAIGPANPTFLRVSLLLLVVATAWIVGVAALDNPRSWIAPFLGVLFVLLWAAGPEGLAWLTSINAVFFFACALLATMTLRRLAGHTGVCDLRRVALAGILIGLVPLVRSNWILAAGALVVLGLVNLRTLRERCALVGAAVVPVAIVTLAYAASGQVGALWRGAALLPLIVGGPGIEWTLPDGMASLFVVSAALLGLSAAVRLIRGVTSGLVVDACLLVAAFGLTIVSAVQKPDYAHHSTQLIPFVLFGLGRLLEVGLGNRVPNGFQQRAAHATAVIALTSLVLLALPREWGTSFVHYRLGAGSDFGSETARQEKVVDAVRRTARTGSVWAGDEHYVGYRLGKRPIVPIAAHPALLFNRGAQRAFYGSEFPSKTEAVKTALHERPTVVVRGPRLEGELDVAGRRYLADQLERHYTLRFGPDARGVEVWERK